LPLVEPYGAKQYDLEFGRGNCKVSCAWSAEDGNSIDWQDWNWLIHEKSVKYK